MTRHVTETDLALFASNDVSLWSRITVRWHTANCEACRKRVETYRLDRDRVKQDAAELPEGLNWDRLAAEMAANIRVGLAAGECVAPRRRKHIVWGWRASAVVASVAVLLTVAFWLNLPASDTESLARAFRGLTHVRGVAPVEEREPVVEASPGGIELRENGSALRISQGTRRPVGVSVNAEGSASARYVDTDTGQITITSVMYVP